MQGDRISIMDDLQRIEDDLAFLHEFRANVIHYDDSIRAVFHLERNVDSLSKRRDLSADEYNQLRTAAMESFVAARAYIIKNSVTASRLAHAFGVGYILTICPPPAVGGYKSDHNVFEAFVKDELPFQAKVKVREVLDILDQIQGALERGREQVMRDNEDPFNGIKKVVGRCYSSFLWMFKTERDRTIVKWLFFGTWAILIFRYLFGIRFEDMGQAFAKWLTK